MFEGEGERAGRDQKLRAWLAWHVAALSRAAKLPRLADLTGPARENNRRRDGKPMTPADQEAVLLTMKYLHATAAPPAEKEG